MREETINVYRYDELSEEVKERVLERMSDVNVDYKWWEFVFEDAETIGLKLEAFDLGSTYRGAYCDGTWIDDAEEAAEKILQEHGEECETYKDALDFQAELKQAMLIYERHEDYDPESMEFEDSAEYEDMCEEFLRTLLEDYRIILEKEYEYLTSEEAIVDTIEANEYEFTKDGEIWRC